MVEVLCAICWTAIEVDDEARRMVCPTCGVDYGFYRCGRCGSIGQEEAQRGRWRCGFCGYGKTWREPGDSSTAQERNDELKRHGIKSGDPDIRLVGGFTVVGGSGFSIVPGAVCSVLALPVAVHIVVEMGDRDTEVLIAYRDVTALSVSGGGISESRGFIGGGFGFWGAFEGILVASILNAASRKTKVSTGMHIGSTRGEVLLHHAELTSDAIRSSLSPLFTRYNAAKHSIESGPSGSVTPPTDPCHADRKARQTARVGAHLRGRVSGRSSAIRRDAHPKELGARGSPLVSRRTFCGLLPIIYIIERAMFSPPRRPAAVLETVGRSLNVTGGAGWMSSMRRLNVTSAAPRCAGRRVRVRARR